MKIFYFLIAGLLGLLAGPLFVFSSGTLQLDQHWSAASHTPVGIAPDPATTAEAVVQIYAARAYGWRGAFGVHTWIATKPEAGKAYHVFEVIGWRAWRGLPVVARSDRAPDARWFGNMPELILDLRGGQAAKAIPKIWAAAQAYPFQHRYRVWPGPNSNTFVAHVIRQVPELKVELPPHALGKDFLTSGVFASATSKTGYQFSLWGLFGVLVAADEGLELNILGLTLGFDLADPALKIPGLGRIEW